MPGNKTLRMGIFGPHSTTLFRSVVNVMKASFVSKFSIELFSIVAKEFLIFGND